VSEFVLDASALLALVNQEEGAGTVARLLGESSISAVNLSEAAARLTERGVPSTGVRQLLGILGLTVVPFDEAMAYRASELRGSTRKLGLSLGDRACLATAAHLGACAVTADRAWSRLRLGVRIKCIR
jgi:PIN domain nuclease of toxin-antitoxin system